MNAQQEENQSPIDDVEWERVFIVLSYAAGGLMRSRHWRTERQIEEDNRMAGICWLLVRQVRSVLARRNKPALAEDAGPPRVIVAGDCLACGRRLENDGRLFFCEACAERARREARMPGSPVEAIDFQLFGLLSSEQLAELYQRIGRRLGGA